MSNVGGPYNYYRFIRPPRSAVPSLGALADEATESRPSPWPQIVAVGAVGFIGLGLLWGMSRASTPTASRYRWGGW